MKKDGPWTSGPRELLDHAACANPDVIPIGCARVRPRATRMRTVT